MKQERFVLRGQSAGYSCDVLSRHLCGFLNALV
jgi:hypothetical protein